MTHVWARELGKYGIRVNEVAPGFVATEMVKQVPEKIITALESRIPLGRLAEPVEIAKVMPHILPVLLSMWMVNLREKRTLSNLRIMYHCFFP